MMHENTDVANSGADDYTEAGYHPESERGLLTPVCSENYTSVVSLSQVQCDSFAKRFSPWIMERNRQEVQVSYQIKMFQVFFT